MEIKILDRYIIKKFLGTFIYAIILIIALAVVFDFSENVDDFIEDEIPISEIIFEYYLNFIPYFANLFSFLFTFIAVIYFTSKMSSNNEFVAILSTGVSIHRLLVPYFVSALIIAIFSFLLSNYIIPPANKVRVEFDNRYFTSNYQNLERNIHRQIEPGLFIYMRRYNLNNNSGIKFSMEKIENGKLKAKLMADQIKWDTTKNKWVIHNYYIRHIDGLTERIEKGLKKDTSLNIPPSEFARKTHIMETMNTRELNEYIEIMRMRGEPIEEYLIEKYRRTASPFAVFILTLIGFSVAIKKTRGGTGILIALGLLLSFTYILFMQISSQLAIGEGLNPVLAVWAPNIVFLIISILLYRYTPK